MRSERKRFRRNGFTLVVVLVVMAALVLMAVGVLAVIGIERKTARSYVDAKRAEWIARAGMEDVRGLLRWQTANDDFLIVSKPGEQEESDKLPLDYLFLARGEGGGEQVDWKVYPLFSSESTVATGSDLDSLIDPASFIDGESEEVEALQWADPARLGWMPVEDGEGRMVGRYAFWVEDLQGKIKGEAARDMDPAELGQRVEWPFPAPGVGGGFDNSDLEIALHALDPAVTGDEDTSDVDERLQEAGDYMVSPGSVLAATGFVAPLKRDKLTGRLDDELARSLEENVAAEVRPYSERATVPFAVGISEEAAGQPKLNLNEMLSGDRSEAIDRWAEWVDQALPDFEERKGGFPDDYLRTLAANIFDYADLDGDASVEAGEYRGLDAYPLVSEYAMRYRWEDFRRIGEQKYFILTAAVYVELWNMSDQEAAGTVQVSYDSAYVTDIDLVAGIELGSAEVLEDPSVVAVSLLKEDGDFWLPPVTLDSPLQPNEYRMIKAGEVEYRYPSEFVLSPIELREQPRGTTGYRMRWNGIEVDRARGQVVRREMNLHYPTKEEPETRTRLRQRIETCIPAHSYSVDPNAAEYNYVNNMGDPRMSMYLGEAPDGTSPDKAMAPNKYGNYSPHRRTIRWNTVYRSDSATKPKVYGRVMPSEWPDGGHDSEFGSVPAGVKNNGSEGDQRIDPDDPQWLVGLPDPLREEAPMRLSNRGVFFSACEMGRAYDPLMWIPSYDSKSDSARIQGGVMPSSRSSWPSVEVGASPSPDHGGGNTLRIGRAEHPEFEVPGDDDFDLDPGRHAAHLLDLFHVGRPKSTEQEVREGALMPINAKVNLNTASATAIRTLVVGNLGQDPILSRQLSKSHSTKGEMARPTKLIELGTPVRERAGDVIAEAIIEQRPFTSAAELASIEDQNGEKIFGNREMYSLGEKIEWSDSAAEEIYARIYEASTLRSRNFRVWVVGQAVVPRATDASGEPVVLAESRKVFNLFADPGSRDDEGAIDERSYEPKLIHENDF